MLPERAPLDEGSWIVDGQGVLWLCQLLESVVKKLQGVFSQPVPRV